MALLLWLHTTYLLTSPCPDVQVNERLSPSELLARGQSLYGYGYPGYHPYSYPYGGYPYPYVPSRHCNCDRTRILPLC